MTTSYRQSLVRARKYTWLPVLVGVTVFAQFRDAQAAVTVIGNVTPAPPGAGGNVAAPFLVGDAGNGQLTINGGSVLSVTGGSATVGDDVNAIGIVTITGLGSTLSALSTGADIVVGNLGTADVLITDFGQVLISDDFIVGAGNDSSGLFTIEDLGSVIDVNDTVSVGQLGEGVVEVLNNARMFADDTIIGQGAAGVGRITIAGAQTFWRQTNAITIGDSGRGTLELLDGAELETTSVVAGSVASGSGIIDIDGTDSIWEVTGFMNLGVNGQSTMSITNGARVVNTTQARLATATGSQSLAIVSGTQSLWDIGNTLTVGEAGFGTLEILAGGRVVTGGNVILGDFTNSRGEVTVDGIDSTFRIEGDLDVSQPAEAKLTVSNGGYVDVTFVVRVAAAGEIELDGGRIRAAAASGVTNSGLIRGGGDIVATVNNQALGEIRTSFGDELVLHGTVTNAGLIDMQGGELEVFGTTNNIGDVDVRDGILRFQNVFTNSTGGQLAIVGGEVDVYGIVINNAGAQVVVGSESLAAFHDSFTNNGSLLVTPGSELLTLENLGLGAGGSMTVQLADSDALDGFGQVLVGGNAAINGELNVELVDGFLPTAGDSFQIITAGIARNGTFTSEVLPALGGGLSWDVVYNPTSVVLSVVGSGITGDYNNDGVVDAADYVLWRKLDGTAGPLANDATPGSVDSTDYTKWREHFGEGGAGSGNGANNGNVPEPTTAACCLIAFAIRALSRRRTKA